MYVVPLHVVTAVLSCLGFTCLFVGSLYIWTQALTLHRDHTKQLKRRIISVTISSILSVLYLRFLCSDDLYPEISFWHILGVHTTSLVPALVLPLLLTMILFLGPLIMMYYDWDKDDIPRLSECLGDLVWWRNIVVGPFTEELVFRACMCPILLAGGFPIYTTVIGVPLFFGIAHVHHITQHLHKSGADLKSAWLTILLQLCYTTVFGIYSAFLFVRTGHLVSPVLAHVFCNYMGFPHFELILDHPHKNVVMVSFVAGLVLFYFLLFSMTDPSIYHSIFFANA